jgi:general secretion pathway protein G
MTVPTRAFSHPATASKTAGFTLVELLVVLAILGLLMGLVMPPIIHHFERAKAQVAHLEIENLESALDLFRLDVGRYPSQREGLVALVEKPASLDRWQGPYLKQRYLPNDPWGHPYRYRIPGQHGDFDLYSLGASDADDDAAAAKPEITNWQKAD